jgi:hypothetical protein
MGLFVAVGTTLSQKKMPETLNAVKVSSYSNVSMITCMAVAPRGTIFTGHADGSVMMLSYPGEAPTLIAKHKAAVTCIIVRPWVVYSGDKDGRVLRRGRMIGWENPVEVINLGCRVEEIWVDPDDYNAPIYVWSKNKVAVIYPVTAAQVKEKPSPPDIKL